MGQHISEITCKATKTLGFLRRNLALANRHTKEVAYKTLVRPQLEYAAPIWRPYNETQTEKVEKLQRTAARWTCRRWRRNTSSVGEMLDELEWPSLESCRERSSLTFFYKIHSGTVSLDKDEYLTPAPNLRRTRASLESQYTRTFAYSDALKNSFFSRTIPVWNSPELFRFGIVSLLQWSYPRPLRNLRLLFKSLARRHAFQYASHLYLVNSFNGSRQMFSFPLTKF